MDNLIDGVLTISKLDTTAYKYQEVDLNEILNISQDTNALYNGIPAVIRDTITTGALKGIQEAHA